MRHLVCFLLSILLILSSIVSNVESFSANRIITKKCTRNSFAKKIDMLIDIDSALSILLLPSVEAKSSSPFMGIPTTLVASLPLISFSIFKFFVYSRMQLVSASMLSNIPPNQKVVEIDAKDGKNIFYLPRNTDYTAIISPPQETDEKKLKEKNRMNEQMVLECVGKANKEGLNIKGKLRSKTNEIPGKSVDVVISTGALGRSSDTKAELVQEVYRILRPGGLFVFVEPDGKGDTIQTLSTVFPKEIKGEISAGEKLKRSKVKLSAASALATVNDSAIIKKGKKNLNKGKGNKRGGGGFSSESDSGKATSLLETNEEDGESDIELESTSRMNGGEGEGEGEGEGNKLSSQGVATATATATVRPGLTHEVLQNLFDPYVTGIAIRP